jgi:hypothetical protein
LQEIVKKYKELKEAFGKRWYRLDSILSQTVNKLSERRYFA